MYKIGRALLIAILEKKHIEQIPWQVRGERVREAKKINKCRGMP